MWGLGTWFKRHVVFPLHGIWERQYYQKNKKYRQSDILYRYFRLRDVDRKKDIYALFTYTHGRFGNLYIILRNALIFSEYVGINQIISEIHHPLFSFPSGDTIQFSLLHDIRQPNVLVPRERSFFFRLNPSQLDVTPEAYARVYTRLRAILCCPRPPLDKDALVVHLRGGDVFTPTPPSDYRQPPLCWYQACIRAHQKFHPGLHVILVFEDMSNPCTLLLQQWCMTNNIPVRLQSSSLQEDYGYLMAAGALVSSSGTFTTPALELNPSLQRVYLFKEKYCPPHSYIPANQWANTEAQRRLMVEFPLEKLRLPADLYAAARHVSFLTSRAGKNR